MDFKFAVFAIATLTITACASGSAVRTSSNTMVIQASAAPLCRSTGAANVAQQLAAIETLRAGFDSYVILDGSAANNVSVASGPGASYTTGRANVSGNTIDYKETTQYRPGMPTVSGTYDQSFAIRMYRAGEPGSETAIPAREVLGPKWEAAVKGGVQTCL